MKTHFLLTILLLFSSSMLFAQNNQIIKLFEKYENEDNVTVVSISKAMFNLIPDNITSGKVNLKNITSKIESMLILTSDNLDMTIKMNEDFKSFIDVNKNYEELMRVKDGKSNITFHAIKNGELINEFLMLVNDEGDFAAIRIAGNFLMEDIQQILEDN